VTNEELVSFIINAYKSRKKLVKSPTNVQFENESVWATEYINKAIDLKLLSEHFEPNKLVLRKDAAEMIKKLVNLI
jgi:hypothetical protein